MYGYKPMYTSIVCADGFSMSVQASETHYCTPKDNKGPYTSVEVGFPSASDDDLLPYMERLDGEISPEGAVYGYVPVEVVHKVIENHGGRVSGRLPPDRRPMDSKAAEAAVRRQKNAEW